MNVLRHRLGLLLLPGLILAGGEAAALDSKQKSAEGASIDDVATMIRKKTDWQILEASPRQKDSGSQYFRFKLLGTDGKVRIINIDPEKPSIRRLE